MNDLKMKCTSTPKIKVVTNTKIYLCFGLDFFSVGKVTLYMGDYNLEEPTSEINNIEYIG